ncbi:MAG: hypothetical protein V1929_04045 [bacterium]
MDTKKIIALVLIGLIALALIINKGFLTGSVSVNLLVTTVAAAKSIVLLGAVALGVVIGILLK